MRWVSELKSILKLRTVFPKVFKMDYDSRTLQKMRGIDGNGKEIDFSIEEKKKIISGIDKLIERLEKIKAAIQKTLL